MGRYDPDQDPDEQAQQGFEYVDEDTDEMAVLEQYFEEIEGDMGRDMLYRTAERLVDPGIDEDDLATCVEVYADHPAATETGYLFAAVDAVGEERYHVFDHPELEEIGLNGVGYGLDADETLVIRTPVEEAGWYAEGTVVNTAEREGGDAAASGVLGLLAEGTVINTGDVYQLGDVRDGAMVRNRGQVDSARLSTGRLLNEGSIGSLHQGTWTVVNRGRIGTIKSRPGYGEDGLIISDGEIGELPSGHGMLVNFADDTRLQADRGIHLNYGEDIVPEQDGGRGAQLFDPVNSHEGHRGWSLIADQDRLGQRPGLQAYLEDLGETLDPQRPFEELMADLDHEEPRSEDRIRDAIALRAGAELHGGPDDHEEDTDGV